MKRLLVPLLLASLPAWAAEVEPPASHIDKLIEVLNRQCDAALHAEANAAVNAAMQYEQQIEGLRHANAELHRQLTGANKSMPADSQHPVLPPK